MFPSEHNLGCYLNLCRRSQSLLCSNKYFILYYSLFVVVVGRGWPKLEEQAGIEDMPSWARKHCNAQQERGGGHVPLAGPNGHKGDIGEKKG